MANVTSYQADILPLFSERDIHAMSKAFNLGSYDDVKAHAAAIYDRIRGIGGAVMPPPPPRGEGPWPQSRIDLFAKMDGGRVSTLRWEPSMSTGADQSAELKFVVTNTLIVGDIRRSVAFYRDVLGATVLREGEPTFLRLGNIWLTINGGGGPTDDKPESRRCAAPRSKYPEQLHQPSRERYQTLLRGLVVTGREIHHRAQSPCNGDAVLHARSGRLPH